MGKGLKRVAHLAAHGAELSPGAHSVDERTGQSESTSGQEADRRQDAVFCPPCSILSGTQPLSGRWRMISSFCPVICTRCGRSFIAPGPRGHICPQCQKERRMNREKASARNSRRIPKTGENRGRTSREARPSRPVEPVRVPVQLVESRWQDMLDQGILTTCPRMHLTASRLPCGERSECFGLSRCQFVPQNMNRPLRRTFF